MADMMLARTFNPRTQCWEGKGLVSIPVERMDEILRPAATVIDLLALLTWRDNRKAKPHD